MSSLNELKAELVNEFQMKGQLTRKTMATCYGIGRRLTEAKSLCKHGEWIPFLKSIECKRDTAARYMRLFNGYAQMSDVQTFDSMTDALSALNQEKEKDHIGQKLMEESMFATAFLEYVKAMCCIKAHPFWYEHTMPLYKNKKHFLFVVSEIAESYKDVGQLHPVVMYEGMILDGMARYGACLMINRLGVPMELEYMELPEKFKDDPVGYLRSQHSPRRNLTEADRAFMASKDI